MRLIHFSDLHVWRHGFDRDWAIKRVLGRANLILRRSRKFPPQWGEALVERIARECADGVVFSGDLTTASLQAEFLAAKQLLAPIAERWGERFLAIPGNHDVYTPRAQREGLFATRFLGRKQVLPATLDYAEGVGVVIVDHCVARSFTSRGHVTTETIRAAAAAVARQKARTPLVIVVGHYPLVFPGDRRPKWEHALPLRRELARALADAGADLYLHGHKHERWVTRPACAPTMLHINAGSSGIASKQPQRAAGYLRLDLDAQGLQRVEAIVARKCPHTRGFDWWRTTLFTHEDEE